jgi:hypothetical protein
LGVNAGRREERGGRKEGGERREEGIRYFELSDESFEIQGDGEGGIFRAMKIQMVAKIRASNV